MKRKHIFIGAAMVVCAGLAVFGLLRMRASNSGTISYSDDEPAADNVPPIVSVQVGELKRVTLHRYIGGYGTVEAAPAMKNEAAASAALAAPMAGIVFRVNVVAGQSVQKGAILAELNSGAVTFDYAKAELGRQKQLFAQQNTSLKNLQDAQAQLASLEIVSPISGTVTSFNLKPGQAVDTTTTVAEVVDLNRLAVSTKIPAEQSRELQSGQDVEIETDPPVTTSLDYVSPTVDTSDGTVLAWASLPSDSRLLSGQFVQLKIVTAVHTNCLAAPAESVITDNDGNNAIWLVSDDEATKTSVQTGFHEDDWVEISAPGLSETNRIVTIGAYGLPDKTKIKIVNPSGEATNSPDAQ